MKRVMLKISIFAILAAIPAHSQVIQTPAGPATVPGTCLAPFTIQPPLNINISLGLGIQPLISPIIQQISSGLSLKPTSITSHSGANQNSAVIPAQAGIHAFDKASDKSGLRLSPERRKDRRDDGKDSWVNTLAHFNTELQKSHDNEDSVASKSVNDQVFDAAKTLGSSNDGTAIDGAVLEPGAWLPENRTRLERLIREYGRGGPKWDPAHPPLATFDWDNTMMRNDIAESLFYHLIREMRFKFELKDKFWNKIPEKLGRDAIRAHYQALKDLPLAQAKKTQAYRSYRKLFHHAYEEAQARYKEFHLDFGWFTELMEGLSVEEVERAAEETMSLELARPVGHEWIRENAQDPHPIRINAGLRPYAEMFDLAAKLQAAGWEVRIVTGSNEWTAARFAARAGIPREHVHGVLSRVEDGKLTGEVIQRTWGRGKADVILEKAGRPSLLAAGDSAFDLDMLRLSQGEKLVIDRGNEKLRAEAEAKGWLLQPPFLSIPKNPKD